LALDYLLRMGLGGGLFGLITTEIIGTVLSQVGLRQNQLDQFAFIRGQSPVAFAGLLVAAAITAPIVEELFFRGMLFGLLRRRHSLPVAYLVSGLLFTVLHLEPTRMNVTQMAGLAIGIFVLGTLLAWLYQHTGSLLPGIVAHAVNNATGLILFYAITPR
jgi:membrane protease YdiL (CAAX protease family)